MWIVLSLAASVLWGLVYILDEKVYKYISVTTALGIASFFAFIFMVIIAGVRGELMPDLRTLAGSKEAMILMIVLTVVFVAAEICIGLSIDSKNATLAALVEVSYPLFTALFAVLLYKTNHLTPSVLVGGFLIMSGVLVISVSHK